MLTVNRAALGVLVVMCSHVALAQAEDRPSEHQSLDDLFSPPTTEQPASNDGKPTPDEPQEMRKAGPESIDGLFSSSPAPDMTGGAQQTPAGQSTGAVAPVAPLRKASTEPVRISGFFQNGLAYTYPRPSHWTKFRNMLDVNAVGRTPNGLQWILGGRLSYDPIFNLTDYYSDEVRKDQRLEGAIRETYLDVPAGDWEFRLGRQNIVWGEMVGLFFADVVSAKDLRELALPDFDILRIPQWAGRAEYFQGDFHAEAIWIPYMTYDDIGKPGAEFYPFKPPDIPGAQSIIANEKRPRGLDEMGYGLRMSYLVSGWDLSGIAYSSPDPTPAFARLTPLAPPLVTYQPIHNRVHKLGATLGKDLGPMVLKAEAVYTLDKLVNVTRLSDMDGLVKQNVLDYIVGLEWSLPRESRLNIQAYQRWYPDHDPDLVEDSIASGFTVYASTKALHKNLEPSILFIHSLDTDDWLSQLKLKWEIDGHWRAVLGADIFGGHGLFGQFDKKDRLYTEVRYSF